jgi:hypothetical protein
MTISRPAAALSVALGLAACVDTGRETASADDVLALVVDCGDVVAACVPVADGRTPLRARLCLVTDRRHADQVPATVRTSTGAWQQADAAQQTVVAVDLAATHCPDGDPDPAYLDLTFIPGRAIGPARVDATVGTFTQSASFELTSAPFREIELRPAVLDLGAARTIAVTATVRALLGGAPSAGSYVELAIVDAQPPGATAAVLPSVVELDAAGVAATTLQTSTGITAVTLRATAHAIAVGGVAPPPLSRDLVLTDVP